MSKCILHVCDFCSHQYAKSQAEKLAKRVEEEKAATNTELIQCKVEVSKLREEVTTLHSQQSDGQDTVEKLTLELEVSNKQKLEVFPSQHFYMI